MKQKATMVHDGEKYYSMPAAARLLGTNVTKLRQIIIEENIEWENFRTNGRIWLSAKSLIAYMERCGKL